MLGGRKGLTQLTAALGLSFAIGMGSPLAAQGTAPGVASINAPTRVPADDADPATTKDPQIALDDLELLLEPMTKEEIESEVKGWFALLRAKEREITVAELDVRRKNREIVQLEKQRTSAAALAKVTAKVKAAGNDASDKRTAARDLAEAQRRLLKTVETAQKEGVKEEKKAEATSAAMAKQVDDGPPPSTLTDSEPADARTVRPASDTAVQQKVADVTATTQKETTAVAQVKSLVDSVPVVTSGVRTAGAAAPEVPNAVIDETSKTAKKLAEKVEEATAAKASVKVRLVDFSAQLMDQRTALVDRLKLVLDKWEAKGGDGKLYRLYIASIGGIKIDVTDRAATWARISDWLVSDEGGLRLARDVGVFLAYIIGSMIVAKMVRAVLHRFMTRAHVTSHLLHDFILAATRPVIVSTGFMLALSALEVNLAPLLAAIGAAGFVVAFALQGTLSNLASGLLIMVFRPFDVGDEVEVGGGIRGNVTHVTIFSTYIRTEHNLAKIVPNDNIWKNVIVNQTTRVMKTPPSGDMGQSVNAQKPDERTLAEKR